VSLCFCLVSLSLSLCLSCLSLCLWSLSMPVLSLSSLCVPCLCVSMFVFSYVTVSLCVSSTPSIDPARGKEDDRTRFPSSTRLVGVVCSRGGFMLGLCPDSVRPHLGLEVVWAPALPFARGGRIWTQPGNHGGLLGDGDWKQRRGARDLVNGLRVFLPPHSPFDAVVCCARPHVRRSPLSPSRIAPLSLS
jgi:hypothetical protein